MHAKALYTEGTYGGPEFHDASDWSPGAPLLYAAAFYATGGAREGTARIVELPGANLYMFLSNDADVLREIRAVRTIKEGRMTKVLCRLAVVLALFGPLRALAQPGRYPNSERLVVRADAARSRRRACAPGR